MKPVGKITLALVGATLIASCSSTPREPRYVPPVQQTNSIQGNWNQVGNTLLAKFGATQFESINTQTNQVVAAGTYKVNSASDIRIEFVGALSGRGSAQCQLANPNLLNCKASNGSGFQMQRV